MNRLDFSPVTTQKYKKWVIKLISVKALTNSWTNASLADANVCDINAAAFRVLTKSAPHAYIAYKSTWGLFSALKVDGWTIGICGRNAEKKRYTKIWSGVVLHRGRRSTYNNAAAQTHWDWHSSRRLVSVGRRSK